MKFKVGDRVKCVNNGPFNTRRAVIGKIGTVRVIANGILNHGIEFDEDIDGHDLGHSDFKYGHCWWCGEDMLEPVEEGSVLEPVEEGSVLESEPETNKLVPIKKFLFIEDGSVDVDELGERLMDTNPEILIVVYRQGSASPELVDVEK